MPARLSGWRGLRPVFPENAFPLAALTALVFGLILPSLFGAAIAPYPAPAAASTLDLAHLPLNFEPNYGQTAHAVRYLAHTHNGTLYFEPSGVSISPQRSGAQSPEPLRMNFLGAGADTALQGGDKSRATVNYLVGSDPSAWHKDIPTYSSIHYTGLYAGVDLTYTGGAGLLKGTYTLTPGSSPAQIRWRYDGTTHVAVDSAGNLQITARGSALTEQAPVAWQEIDGKRVAVGVRYDLGADGSVGFDVGGYDPAFALTIDPTLTYSTYFGGNDVEIGEAIAVDPVGNIYLTGYTFSRDFPLQAPYQPNIASMPDAFVSKLSPDGSTLLYSTYLGGNNIDMGYAITVDAQGGVFVAGRTQSPDFPLQNAIQPTLHGGVDGFVTHLSPSGSALVYSTFLGANGLGGIEAVQGIAVDGQGNAYVTGQTFGTDFPTLNAIQPTFGGGNGDAFVTKFTPMGLLAYSTYLGGGDGFSGTDKGSAIAVDSAGQAYITGFTTSSDFPMANAFQPEYGGGEGDVFVSKINAAGSAYVYSTYLGGQDIFGEFGHAIAADNDGNAYVTGQISSPDFPTVNAFQGTAPGSLSAFVTKFNPSGSALVFSTYLGGSSNGSQLENGAGIGLDAQRSVYVAGTASTTDFPTVNAIQAHNAGATDVFVTRFNPSGQTLAYSTYLGGSSQDEGWALAVHGDSAYVTGYTYSPNFPTVNPYQGSPRGSIDAFVARIADGTGATPTPTATARASATVLATGTGTVTATPTAVATSTPTTQATATASATAPPSATATETPQPTATDTPVAPTSTATPCALSFSDVHPSDYFYDAVQYLACHGVISGYADGTFRPFNNTTRGQLSKVIVLGEGWPLDCPPDVQHFSDVPPGSPFFCYVETMVRHSVISGYGDGTFRPGANVTRGQLCKIVVLAEGWPDSCTTQHFSDVPPGHPFFCYVETAFARGIISGYADGTFRPGNNAIRGQISKIVYQAITAP
jgi:hypothetical protein